MRRRRLVPVLGLVLALALCGVSGWSYARARGDGDLAYAQSRDAALAAGRRHIARLNSFDARDVDTGLAAWLDATTGPLRDELRTTRAKSAQVLKEQGATARAEVTDAAVTELDDRSGTARLIATVRIEAQPRTGATTTDRKRFEAGLTRTGGGWKLTSLTAVAVGTG
ncbi:hypothetical protein [Streptomyces sp. BPTC-684]|uniref:hypothetical protein n=1 Tax=Streptomyces sp. BPTC-684 TaxID=3043734 RepID=UPI0024B19B34|nr:hypothetical protein [Streptomyces sp. BPTC-684]WHM35580.1 hypothetical protein QIY60_00770 [Streptomyces sp. BPTC-684]